MFKYYFFLSLFSLLLLNACSSSYEKISKNNYYPKEEFSKHLFEAYKKNASFEANEMHDWNSAKLYSEKALLAASGEKIKPEKLSYWKIPKDKMWITVHSSDDEAKNIWLDEIGISKDRLSIISTNDNFWSMGDVGPCGPCTEIFYDFGDKYEGNPPGHGDEGERYVEIWNFLNSPLSDKSSPFAKMQL